MAGYTAIPASGGGAGGTVSVTSPITGDGSAGAPIGISAATTSAAGSQSANDKLWMDLSESAWARTQIAFVRSKVAAIDQFKTVPIGYQGGAGTLVTDANIDGAGLAIGASNTRWLTTSVVSSIATHKFAIAGRCQFGTPAAATTAWFCLTNTAGSRSLGIGVDNATSAAKFSTNITAYATPKVASAINADTSLHDFVVISDATTVTLWIDQVDTTVTYSTASITTDEQMQLAIVNVGASTVKVQYALIGWV